MAPGDWRWYSRWSARRAGRRLPLRSPSHQTVVGPDEDPAVGDRSTAAAAHARIDDAEDDSTGEVRNKFANVRLPAHTNGVMLRVRSMVRAGGDVDHCFDDADEPIDSP